jgi:ribosome-binding protein aMBF1 (putative translation factor)
MSCREATPYQCQYVPIPFSRQQGPAYSYESHLEETILDRCNSCAASPGMAADECEIDPPRPAAKHNAQPQQQEPDSATRCPPDSATDCPPRTTTNGLQTARQE